MPEKLIKKAMVMPILTLVIVLGIIIGPGFTILATSNSVQVDWLL
ncbi:Uncharacterised protein [Serratia fonticola]|uniref:Uncharacterized protein n=1 Tax=Serratia fonticola TaxID=47917 RepID=A0A4U9UB19_SERFO|nr:Uncharacterised protein [Serratia fonticola]